MAKPPKLEEISLIFGNHVLAASAPPRNLLEVQCQSPPQICQVRDSGAGAGWYKFQSRLCPSSQLHSSLKWAILRVFTPQKLASAKHIFFFPRVVKQLSEHHLTQKSMFSQALQGILIFLALLPPPCKYIQKSGLYIHELAFGWLHGLHVPPCL